MKLDKADRIFIWWMLKGKDVFQIMLVAIFALANIILIFIFHEEIFNWF